jgi:hypothetical protein
VFGCPFIKTASSDQISDWFFKIDPKRTKLHTYIFILINLLLVWKHIH